LVVYQEALREYMMETYPDLEIIEPGPHGLKVAFFFWRSLNYGGQRRNPADATNLTKATEDALQGLVYLNDRANRSVCGNVVAQARDIEPLIIVSIERYEEDPFDSDDMRRFARAALEGNADA
jgi:hypothetical protein